ncbi:CXXC motif containing zinc binding protein [Aplysia californica]|uniref:CXXC motif containing zinc binding protein n=1 Tax=Aplysia californica TaxID=6500 RepID=A0ABM0JQ98_APLCA|nr:CXXC motif containing zinc binding protein [Aplysia californica]
MKTGLQISAQLENIGSFKASGDDFRWYLKLSCSSCGEETSDYVYCTLRETSPLTGGRGQASLVLKCKLCKRENSIDIVTESLSPYTEEDSGKFKTIVAFDCRGVQPIDFSPRVGWEAVGLESQTLFSDIDLNEAEWFDYDEKAGESVSITELKHQFVPVKH